MTRERLWEIYLEKNPAFRGETVEFTAAGLRHFFDKTWETAYFAAGDDMETWKPGNSPLGASATVDELLGAFGMTR